MLEENNNEVENEDVDIDLDGIDLEALDLDLNDDDDDAEDELEEQTAAAASIAMKPSRSVNIANAVNAMASMSDDDLNHFAASIAKVPNPIADGTAAKNKASVAMKTVTKEEMNDLFGDDLSEDFRDKTMVLFESAVNGQVALQVTEISEALAAKYNETAEALEEAYALTLEEEVTTLSDTLYEQIDSYVNHVATSWLEENEVAINSTLRGEIAEDFMGKMKGLFVEHNLNIPDDSEDVFAEMLDVNSELEARLNEATQELIDLKNDRLTDSAASALTTVTEGLAATTVDKIKQLAEGIEFDDLGAYTKKLNIIVEHVTKKPTTTSGILQEEAPAIDATTALNEDDTLVSSNPRVNLYAAALSRQMKS